MTVAKIIAAKGSEKLTMLTAYDALTAAVLESCGVDMILVGDSLGTAIMGYKSTLPVTLDDVIHHTIAVRNGAPSSFVIGDMPFLSYGTSVEESVKNAGLLVKLTGANAVKLEGGKEFAALVKAITDIGVPVMGHIGLKPQSINKSGYKIAGKTSNETESLVEDALVLEKAGAFAIVIEGTTEEASKIITERVSIPTIGIGAGKYTDGQVLVVTDMLGLDPNAHFKHNKMYVNLNRHIKKAVKSYVAEVKSGAFPAEEQTFHQK